MDSPNCPKFRKEIPTRGPPGNFSKCRECGLTYIEHYKPGSKKNPNGKAPISPIWVPSKEQFKAAVEVSQSWEEIVRRLGIEVTTKGADIKTLKKRCAMEGLKFRPRLFRNRPDFVENSEISIPAIKQKVITRKLLPYICSGCKVGGEWQGKPLSLHLDHINGENTDHRLENLRFLCPNCHSQTRTYAGKRHLGKSRDAEGKWLDVTPEQQYTAVKQQTNPTVKVIDWPTDEKLLEDVKNSSILVISQLLGCTSSAIKKRLIKRGLWSRLVYSGKTVSDLRYGESGVNNLR